MLCNRPECLCQVGVALQLPRARRAPVRAQERARGRAAGLHHRHRILGPLVPAASEDICQQRWCERRGDAAGAMLQFAAAGDTSILRAHMSACEIGSPGLSLQADMQKMRLKSVQNTHRHTDTSQRIVQVTLPRHDIECALTCAH